MFPGHACLPCATLCPLGPGWNIEIWLVSSQQEGFLGAKQNVIEREGKSGKVKGEKRQAQLE